MPALRFQRQPASGPSWFDGNVAQRLIAHEQREVIPLLTSHIGVRGLYLRPSAASPSLLSGNMLQSVVSLHLQGGRFAGDVCCDAQALPFEGESLCLAYALHVLDRGLAVDPLLEQLCRVLRPEGTLFLLGLSPASPWRLRWMGRGVTAQTPAAVRAALVRHGLKVELQIGVGPLLPGLGGGDEGQERGDGSMLDPLRAGYLLLARKRRAGITALPQRNRARMGALQPQARIGNG